MSRNQRGIWGLGAIPWEPLVTLEKEAPLPGRKKKSCWGDWEQTELALSICWVTLGSWLDLSGPQCLPLENGDVETDFTGLPGDLQTMSGL